ncbi:MAG: glycine cleavage system protein GcvH [Elusimicrobia bacterium]|nr:glycine cleavage system protein GcvH [Elusimicrobiota bacterium]
MVPAELKYTKEHEWVKLEGNKATVGITDFAQDALGDITFIKLPNLGDSITQFQEVGCLESIKSVSNIYSPLSGKVSDINKTLESAPEKINKSAYSEGWIYKLQDIKQAEFDKLLSSKEYEEFLKTLG